MTALKELKEFIEKLKKERIKEIFNPLNLISNISDFGWSRTEAEPEPEPEPEPEATEFPKLFKRESANQL